MIVFYEIGLTRGVTVGISEVISENGVEFTDLNKRTRRAVSGRAGFELRLLDLLMCFTRLTRLMFVIPRQ